MAIHKMRNFGIEEAVESYSDTLTTLYTMHAYCATVSNTAFLVRPVNNYTNVALAVTTTAANDEYIKIVSQSANDATAGTGALSVRIWGILGAGTQTTEDVLIGGVTPETTTNQYIRINKMMVLSCGAGGINDGIICAVRNADSVSAAGVPGATNGVYAIIAAGDGVNSDAHFFTPKGYTAVLTGLNASNDNTTPQIIRVYVKPKDMVTYTMHRIELTGGQPYNILHSIPDAIPELSDVWITADNAADSATTVQINWQFMLI